MFERWSFCPQIMCIFTVDLFSALFLSYNSFCKVLDLSALQEVFASCVFSWGFSTLTAWSRNVFWYNSNQMCVNWGRSTRMSWPNRWNIHSNSSTDQQYAGMVIHCPVTSPTIGFILTNCCYCQGVITFNWWKTEPCDENVVLVLTIRKGRW